MFTIECFIYILIVFYSVLYQLKTIIMYKKNKKKEIKNASGLFVAKDILNQNNYGKR